MLILGLIVDPISGLRDNGSHKQRRYMMKGRPKDLKATPTMSRLWKACEKKMLMAKERQQGNKACRVYQSIQDM